MLDLPDESKKGLQMLSHDVRNLFRSDGKHTSLRYGFFDIMQIIIIMVLCGVMIGVGIKIIFDPASILAWFGL